MVNSTFQIMLKVNRNLIYVGSQVVKNNNNNEQIIFLMIGG